MRCVVATVAGVLFFLFGFSAVTAVVAVVLVRKRWRFTDTPTSDAAHVFPGLSEVHGVVEAISTPVTAASDGAECVWWQYKVQRQEKDHKGNSRWVTEEAGGTAAPFLIRDHSGAIRVIIDEKVSVPNADDRDVEHLSLAQLRPHARVMSETYEPSNLGNLFGNLFGRNEVDEPISEFGGQWRATESRLCVGQQVFATAHARLTPAGDSVELANNDAAGKSCTFELSVGDEDAAKSAHSSGFLIVLMAGVSLLLMGIAGNNTDEGGKLVWLLPLLLVGAAGLVWVIGAWNRVLRSRERGHFAWSLIDVACEQRSLTVPQLESVVGAALAHERSLLEAVAGARHVGRTPSSSGVQAVHTADAAAVQVIARVEAMPSLNTQPNVAHLMTQLIVLNDRVAFGRRFYNDSCERLANRVSQFPDSLLARLARVQPLPLITDLDAPQNPPAAFPPAGFPPPTAG